MHEPPRSDAAGLQPPKDDDVCATCHCRRWEHRADGCVCMSCSGWVLKPSPEAELAALRARTEGLQAAIDTLVRTVNDQARRLVELQQDYEASLNRWNTANGQAHAVIDAEAARADAAEAELTALLASHETLQAERDAANAEAHVYLENTTRLRARVTALDAELAEMRMERAEVGVRHWRAVQRAEEAETKLAATEAAIRALVDKWRQAGSDRARHSYVCVTFIACADALLAVLGPGTDTEP